MKANITTLQVGQHFLYNNLSFVVVDRSEYPFIEARCETEPNEYDGINVIFGNFERVEIPDNAKTWKSKFVWKGNTAYRTETLE